MTRVNELAPTRHDETTKLSIGIISKTTEHDRKRSADIVSFKETFKTANNEKVCSIRFTVFDHLNCRMRLLFISFCEVGKKCTVMSISDEPNKI